MRLRPTFVLYSACLILSFIAVGVYFVHATRAWFVLDDYGFLQQFTGHLRTEQLRLVQGDFGRFVSRNAYWFYGTKLFSAQPLPFYLVNLAILGATAAALWCFVRIVMGHAAPAFLVATVLLVCGPTVWTIAWISNSQHLIPNLFAFLTLLTWYALTTYDAQPRYLLLVATVAMFAVGTLSGIDYVAILLPMLILLVMRPSGGLARPRLDIALVFVICLVIGAYWLHSVARLESGPYTNDYSLSPTLHTLGYYAARLELTTFMLSVLWLFPAVAFVLTWDRRGLMLSGAAMGFYVPFAFLSIHPSDTYLIVPVVFLVAALAYLFSGALSFDGWLFSAFALVVLGFAFYQGMYPMRYISAHVVGKDEHELVMAIASADFGSATIICIEGADTPTSHAATFWGATSAGAAFVQLPNYGLPTRAYMLATDPRCKTAGAVIVTLRDLGWGYTFSARPG